MKKIFLPLILGILLTGAYAQEISPEEMAQQLTERKLYLSTIPDEDKIIYQADNERHRIQVFTDIDCPFCAKFHGNIAVINDAGVTVEYLAFPRQGLNTENSRQMQSIWCSEDKNTALTQAKINRQLPMKTCESDAVANQYLLGVTFGVYGTPSTVLPNGDMRAGYVDPDTLISTLDALSQSTK